MFTEQNCWIVMAKTIINELHTKQSAINYKYVKSLTQFRVSARLDIGESYI